VGWFCPTVITVSWFAEEKGGIYSFIAHREVTFILFDLTLGLSPNDHI